MIYPSLDLISNQLNRYIYEKWGETINGTGKIVELGNIANINEEKNSLQNKIVLTLIKTEEEPSLKNGPFYQKKSSGKLSKQHPAIYFNLYLLISITKKDYREALQLLSDTITFFQSHKVFTDQSSNGDSSPTEDESSFRIVVELCNFTMQETFDMWSNLGNKQLPSAIYKMRLLKFLDREEQKEIPVIDTINVQHNPEERT